MAETTPASAQIPHEQQKAPMSGAAPPRTTNQRLNGAEAIYPYQDETGSEILLEVYRFPGKRFVQRDPRKPAGQWGLLPDTRRVLFHSPGLTQHLTENSSAPIYICEGEKDVLAVEAVGATATCNPMGAGKWSDDYSEQLRSARNVVIIADQDDVGLNHAISVRESLRSVGITPDIKTAAIGKDASDHLAAGLTLDELDDLIEIPEQSWTETTDEPASLIELETWVQFSARATEQIPCIVDGLWPVGSLGFISAPPKKGKTWIGLSLALALATGRKYLASFAVSEPMPVIYVALEGHRAAIRGRIGCLCRGLGLDPDSDDLNNLHLAYKPRGINIADPSWIEAIRVLASELKAGLVLVDVLRAAAAMKENSNEEFGALRRNLSPLLDDGTSVGLLHHFGKLTEISKDRSPGERMAGAGAMQGALDVGIYITGSDEGARRLRIEFEIRDLAEPDTFGIHLAGEGSGPNGGFTYLDKAFWSVEQAPDELDVKAPAADIAAYVRDHGGNVEKREIEGHFQCTDKTIISRLISLRDTFGIDYIMGRGGKPSRLVARPDPKPEYDQESFPESIPESTIPDSGQLVTPGSKPSTEAKTESCPELPGAARNQTLRDRKDGDMQGKSFPESSPSPTERDNAVPASPLHEGYADLPEDAGPPDHENDVPF